MLSVVVRHGSSLAVDIPDALCFMNAFQSVNIERVGDSLIISPVSQPSLAGVLDVFAEFSDAFMKEERGLQEQKQRGWS